jgi:ABC-type uncharacterized transport system permease subunit
MNKNLVLNLLVHGFALAHAVTSLLLFSTDFGDSIPLTSLTIAMIVCIARLYDYPLDVTAILALLCCFAGFYIGITGAKFLSGYFAILDRYAHQVTTFIVTELMGWATFFIVKRNRKKNE